MQVTPEVAARWLCWPSYRRPRSPNQAEKYENLTFAIGLAVVPSARESQRR